jgi:hypothetical protein
MPTVDTLRKDRDALMSHARSQAYAARSCYHLRSCDKGTHERFALALIREARSVNRRLVALLRS